MVFVKKKTTVPVSALYMFAVWCLISMTAHADTCLECHSEWEDNDRAPSKLISTDVHFKAGLGCADCHGGDPTLEDMDDVRQYKNYLGVPEPEEIPLFCAGCHSNPAYMIKHNPSLSTDQFDKYKTSVHGKLLLGKGDTKAANCVSCHSVHDIASPRIPTSTVYAVNIPTTCAECHGDAGYMAEYKIPTDQYEKFAGSVHGIALLERNDLGAPACNDCHGNHGAIPPGVTSISAVCGLCHSLIADEFSRSPHKKAFDDLGYPECEGCHSNHLVQKPQHYWMGTSDSSICVNCHAFDDGTIALTSAETMHKSLVDLHDAYTRAESRTNDGELKGMMVTDLRFKLKEVKQFIIKTGTAIHSFNDSVVVKTAEPGLQLANKVYESAAAKIDEYYYRRYGLGIASLIITMLAVLLYFKIKSIEK